MRPTLSIVVPTLNEERRIVAQLARLAGLGGVDEVIVVDGGSTDRTTDLAAGTKARLITAPRGRAVQMNAGARVARGNVILFLHADVLLPEDAASWVERLLADPHTVAGAFRTRTVNDGASRPLGRLLRLADLRSRYSSLPYGDQALFVRSHAFWKAGAFPEQQLMEDLELSLRLRRIGRIRTAPANVTVSGRRFLARPVFYTTLVNVFPLLYRAGVPADLLARIYCDVR